MEFHVTYVGAEGAGSLTSLLHIMHATNSPYTFYANSESQFLHRRRNQLHTMFALRTPLRGQKVYEDPRHPHLGDALLDKQLIQEMNYLCLCDGIVFVIDSEMEGHERNLYEFELLKRDFALCEVDIDAKPIAFQVNKRDLPNICSMGWVRTNFQTQRCDYVESIATQGIGTLEAIEKLINLME